MNTNGIREHLLARAPWVDRQATVDTVKAGNPFHEMHAVGVGGVSCMQNLRRAHELGCDLFVTHEPAFWEHAASERQYRSVEPGLSKQRFLNETGRVVLRDSGWATASPNLSVLVSAGGYGATPKWREPGPRGQ